MARVIKKPAGTNYKKAGFWIKLASRLLDIIPVAVISVVSAFFYMSHTPYNGSTKNIWHFKYAWEFYIWGITLTLMLLIQFIIIPITTKGQSFGQWVCKVRVVTEERSIKRAVLKREVFFSGAWILSSVLVICLINHTLISKYAATDQKNIEYTTLESLRIGIVTTVGSIAMLLQMIIGISVLVRSDKKGLHDIYAKTEVVYTNKFVKEKNDEVLNIKKIKPQPYKDVFVEWIR